MTRVSLGRIIGAEQLFWSKKARYHAFFGEGSEIVTCARWNFLDCISMVRNIIKSAEVKNFACGKRSYIVMLTIVWPSMFIGELRKIFHISHLKGICSLI